MSLDYLKKELETQDNRATAEPMFVVFSKREYPTTSDYSYDRSYYLEHSDHDEVGETKEEVLEYLKEQYEDDEDYIREQKAIKELEDASEYDFDDLLFEKFEIQQVYVFEVPQFEQAFFTEKAAKRYLEINGHNLTKPFLYVTSMYRNEEMQEIRNYFLGGKNE